MKRVLSSLVPTVLIALAIGTVYQWARPEPCTIRGRVTVDGKAVPAGSVLVVADSPHWATVGFLSASGEYEVTDVPPGPVRLAVRTRRVVRFTDLSHESVWSPRRYEDPGSSGLGLTVRRGVQRYDIDLPGE